MARIRSIKPELLEDERTARLTHVEWRLFVSLLLLADDYGNLRAAPERIHGAALWAHPREDLAKAIEGLVVAGLAVLYVVGGQRYAHINGWEKHQKVDHPGKPLCPALSEGSRIPREDLAKPVEALASDLDQDRDRDQEGSAPVWPGQARDPDALTITGLIALVKASVAKNSTRRSGSTSLGTGRPRAAVTFLDAIPAESRTDLLRAEVKRRISIFAASTDTRITKGNWSVEAFCEAYNRLGQASRGGVGSAEAASRRMAAKIAERGR